MELDLLVECFFEGILKICITWILFTFTVDNDRPELLMSAEQMLFCRSNRFPISLKFLKDGTKYVSYKS